MSTPEQEVRTLTFDSLIGPIQTHWLNVYADSPMTEIFVVSGDYLVVARGAGTLQVELSEGRYQLKYRVGSTSREEWVDLIEDREVRLGLEKTIPRSTAPLDPELWTDDLLRDIQSFAGDSSLLVIVRDSEKSIPQDTIFSVFDSHGRRKRCEKKVFADGHVAALRFAGLSTGAYRLRVESRRNSPVEMCVWVPPHYQTQIYFERCQIHRLQASGKRNLRERAPFLRTAAITTVQKRFYDLDELRRLWLLTEMARSSLTELRNVVPIDETLKAVYQKFDCPMLGLLGGHLLLNALRSRPELASLLDTVISNLATLFGPTCPDVIALRYARHGEKNFVLRMPPMLWQSWNLLAPNADVRNIPRESLASEVGVAITAVRPWLVWKTTLLPQAPQENASATPYVEQSILQTKKTYRQVGALANQYSLPRSTVRTILRRLDAASEK